MYKPSQIILTCGDGTVVAKKINWTRWTSTMATGTTSVDVNRCKPDCASGAPEPFDATITLSGPVSTTDGPAFRRAVIAWTGKQPFGHPTDNYLVLGQVG